MAIFKVIRGMDDDIFEKKVQKLLDEGYELINCSHDGESAMGRAAHFAYLIRR